MPTAEKAQERYNLGTVSNNMPKMFPTLQQRLANMKNIKATTVLGKSGLFSNAASISLITGLQPDGRPDTVYVETPKHMPFMNVQPRMAGQYVGPGDYSMEEANEYNVLGRRFNLARSVSAKQLGGTMAQQGGQQGIEQLVVQLVQAAVAGDQKATQQIEQIMQAAQLGDQLAIQIALVIQKVIQSMKAKQGVKAQLGTKLDYLNKLKGVCPEGSEKVYLKNGGCMCKQKAAKGAELKKEQSKNEILKFKAEKKACGSKLKPKHWGGGTVARGGLTNLQYSGTWGNRGKGNELQSAVERGLSWLGVGPSLEYSSQYYLVDANGKVVKELNPTSTGIAPTPGKGSRVNKVATQTTKVGQQLAKKVYKKMPGYLKNSEDFYHADGTWAGTKKPLWADDIDNAFIMESLGSLK